MILTIGMILAAVAGYFVGRLVARIGVHNEREKAFDEGFRKAHEALYGPVSHPVYTPDLPSYQPFDSEPDTKSSDQP